MKKRKNISKFYYRGCVDKSNAIIFIPGKALLSTQMKMKVDSQENHPSVLHTRTSFWGVNISRQQPRSLPGSLLHHSLALSWSDGPEW